MRLVYELRGGHAPTKEHAKDAGWDLRSCERKMLLPGESHTFDLQLGLQFDLNLPPGFGWYARLAPKSGLADRYGVHVIGCVRDDDSLAGVVDEGYVGNVKVVIARVTVLKNGMPNQDIWRVEKGDKICQVIPEIIARVSESEEVKVLAAGTRGEGGFGSSGTK